MIIKLTALVFILLLSISSATQAETYRYDDIGRLISVTYDDGMSIIYSYDPNGNRLSRTVGVLVLANGDVFPVGAPDGEVTIADALVSLRYALQLITPITADARAHGDVAPLDEDGTPDPDGVLTIADALLTLRKALNLISF